MPKLVELSLDSVSFGRPNSSESYRVLNLFICLAFLVLPRTEDEEAPKLAEMYYGLGRLIYLFASFIYSAYCRGHSTISESRQDW
jgi:hypothetical protein